MHVTYVSRSQIILSVSIVPQCTCTNRPVLVSPEILSRQSHRCSLLMPRTISVVSDFLRSISIIVLCAAELIKLSPRVSLWANAPFQRTPSTQLSGRHQRWACAMGIDDSYGSRCLAFHPSLLNPLIPPTETGKRRTGAANDARERQTTHRVATTDRSGKRRAGAANDTPGVDRRRPSLANKGQTRSNASAVSNSP